MSKSKTTRHALFASATALLLCVVMLVGTTFAWFTDTASTGVNSIQSGTLDVQLLDAADESIEGGTLTWQKAAGHTDEAVLWEPGATYNLQSFKIKNNGNLALKYKISISGITGDNELKDAITWTYTLEDGTAFDISAEGHLAAGKDTGLITISGKMHETAGNEYQGKYIDGVAITVVATQDTVEYDSNGNTYDENAAYPETVGTVEEFNNSLEDGKTIVLTQNLNLAANLSVNNNVTIEGNGVAKITGYPVYVGAENTVTFSGINFDETTVPEKASSVYGSGFKGTMVFENCTFGDNNWESVQITPAGDATIIFNNCTFNVTQQTHRFIHIEPSSNNNLKLNISITNCTFKGCDYMTISNYDHIDLDYIAAGSTMTLGGCTFLNSDETTDTDARVYFCQPASASYARTYDYNAMYNMLTGDIQTYTVE